MKQIIIFCFLAFSLQAVNINTNIVPSSNWTRTVSYGTNRISNLDGVKMTNGIFTGQLQGTLQGERSTEPDFTMVLVPDNGAAVDYFTNTWRSTMQWIADNITTQNIVAAISGGDLSNFAYESEFAEAKVGYDMVKNAGIVYVPIVGNHDYPAGGSSITTRDVTNWNATFGTNYFAGKSWFGGAYNNSTDNYYVKFEVGSRKFMVLALELFPRPEVIVWAQGVMGANGDRETIVATHSYLNHDGSRTLSTDIYGTGTYGVPATQDSQHLWDGFLKLYPNIFLVVCGHQVYEPYSAYLKDVGVNGNIVHQLFINYQTLDYGNNGYLGLLKFRPSLGKIEVSCYETHLGTTDPTGIYTFAYPNIAADTAVTTKYPIMSSDNVSASGLFTGGGTSGLKINGVGNAGLGTTNPLARMHVLGSSITSQTNYSDYTSVSNVLSVPIGSVGVGVTAPVLKTEIRSMYNDPAVSGTSPLGIFALTSSSVYESLYMGISATLCGNDYPAWLQAASRNNLASFKPLLLNPRGGLVGIGTLSPNEQLEVASSPGRMAVSDGLGSERSVLLMTAPIPSIGYGRVDAYKYGAGAGGKPLVLNKSGGKVGVVNTNPAAQLDVTGDIAASDTIRATNGFIGNLTGNAATASTATNALGGWPTNWAPLNSPQFTGNVGIGTTSTPFEPFEVASATGRFITSDGAGAEKRVLLFTAPTAAIDYAKITAYKYGTGAGYKPIVLRGNIGIGTAAAPTTELEVNGTVTATKFASTGGGAVALPSSPVNGYFVQTDGAGNWTYAPNTVTGTNGGITQLNGDTNAIQTFSGSGGISITNLGSGNHTIVLGAHDQSYESITNAPWVESSSPTLTGTVTMPGGVQVDSSGVGIGTSPSYRLHVMDPAFANSTPSVIARLGGGTDSSLGPLYLSVGINPSATAGSRYTSITSGDAGYYRSLTLNPFGGNVGVGTAQPNEPLEIASSTGRFATSDGQGAERRVLLFTSPTAGTDYAKITAFKYGSGTDYKPIVLRGSIGIGTAAAPTAELDVNGNAIVSGTVTATSGFVGSLTGNASSASTASAGWPTSWEGSAITSAVTNADWSTFATNAAHADWSTYATNATLAAYASAAGNSVYAGQAGHATNSDMAITSSYVSGTLTNSITGNALSASYANNATTADYSATSGAAVTATRLATARKINGVDFNGTSDITISAGTNSLTSIRTNFTHNFGTINAGVIRNTNVTVSGVEPGDIVSFAHTSATNRTWRLDGFVTATNTITLDCYNGDTVGRALDGTTKIIIFK